MPVIVETLHGTEAWRKGWKANNLLDRATTHFVSQYIAVSESDSRFLATKKHVPAQKISIIHNGIDVGRFAVADDERNKIRQALGFAKKDFVLIMVARLDPGKGHRVLFEAMHQLAATFPTLKLVCLGEGEEEPGLRSLYEMFGLSKTIRLAGYQHNVAEWFKAADINVLPSFYEGFPLTVLEAMAAGVVTVASNVGGIPEAIQDGVSGMLVPPGDPARLAAAISFLLGDPAIRARMSQAARALVVERFSLEQQVSRTETLYQAFCARSSWKRGRAEANPLLSKNSQPSAPIAIEYRK